MKQYTVIIVSDYEGLFTFNTVISASSPQEAKLKAVGMVDTPSAAPQYQAWVIEGCHDTEYLPMT